MIFYLLLFIYVKALRFGPVLGGMGGGWCGPSINNDKD